MQAENSAATQYVTVAETAHATRLSKMTIYRLIHAGQLPAVRIGRSFRLPRTAIDAFLHGSSAATTNANPAAGTATGPATGPATATATDMATATATATEAGTYLDRDGGMDSHTPDSPSSHPHLDWPDWP